MGLNSNPSNLVWASPSALSSGVGAGGRVRAGVWRGGVGVNTSVVRRHVCVGLHGRGEEIGRAQGRCFGRS